MSGFALPWEEENIKQVIDAFGCIVMGIEEVQDGSKQMEDNDTQQ